LKVTPATLGHNYTSCGYGLTLPVWHCLY